MRRHGSTLSFPAGKAVDKPLLLHDSQDPARTPRPRSRGGLLRLEATIETAWRRLPISPLCAPAQCQGSPVESGLLVLQTAQGNGVDSRSAGLYRMGLVVNECGGGNEETKDLFGRISRGAGCDRLTGREKRLERDCSHRGWAAIPGPQNADRLRGGGRQGSEATLSSPACMVVTGVPANRRMRRARTLGEIPALRTTLYVPALRK